jgi:hypothetical protein
MTAPRPTPMTHTPWKIGPLLGTGVDVFDNKGACAASYCTPEDAATIVRAVNAHDALVAALTNIVANARMVADPTMSGMTDCYAVPLDDIEAARTALATAEDGRG